MTLETVLYLENPPDEVMLEEILVKLGKEPRDIIRTDESEYAALGLENLALTRAELLAALGRPLEAVTALFEER